MKKWMLTLLAIWTAYGCIGCGQKDETVIETNIIQEETGIEETKAVKGSDETKTESETKAGNELETLYGNVESVGEGEFVLDKADVGDNGDSQVMVSNLIDKTLVTVKYTEETRWTVKKIRNRGIDPETDVTSFEGGEQNLEIKQSVEIQGNYDEGMFVAHVIEINIFED